MWRWPCLPFCCFWWRGLLRQAAYGHLDVIEADFFDLTRQGVQPRRRLSERICRDMLIRRMLIRRFLIRQASVAAEQANLSSLKNPTRRRSRTPPVEEIPFTTFITPQLFEQKEIWCIQFSCEGI